LYGDFEILENHPHTFTITAIQYLYNTHSLMEGRRGFRKPNIAPSKPSKRCRSPSSPSPPFRPRSTSQPSPKRRRGSYNPQLTTQEKLDNIIGCIRKYRWSFGDFIRHLVLENSRHNYAPALIEAIWRDKEVIQKLQEDPSFGDATIVAGSALVAPVEAYKHELTALESTSTFGRYTRTLEFNDIQIEKVYSELRSLAPKLLDLMENLFAPARKERRDQAPRQEESLYGHYMLVFSIICFTRRRNTCDNIPKLLGLYFQSMGTKRRVQQTLSGLGVSEAYQTITKLNDAIAADALEHLATAGKRPDIIVVYDNFDYKENVTHQRMGDTGTMRNVTTGKLIYGRCMPPDGLRQDMLNEQVQLSLKDVMLAPGNIYDETQKQISMFCIHNTVRQQFPNAIADIYRLSPCSEISMPRINVLKAEKTHHFSLGPIPHNEGTTKGTYDVLETIFVEQFHREPKDFEEMLILLFGDQKTASIIRGIINERRETASAYDSHRWILPLSAFFHLRQTFLWMIQKQHFGGEARSKDEHGHRDTPSTLYHNMNFWNRKDIPANNAPLHLLEELVLHSFEARIIALLYVQLRKRDIDIENEDAINDYIRHLSIVDYLSLINEVYAEAFSKDVQQPSKAKETAKNDIEKAKKDARKRAKTLQAAQNSDAITPTEIQIDEEFTNHIHFMQQAETYFTLKYAIKHADVGLIKRVISRCCVYFSGSNHSNYAFEMLNFQRLLATEAASPELKQAILANSLVNLQGKEDTWFEIDLLNELLNLSLKEILWTRRNSTFSLDLLFQRCALTASYTGELRACIERLFGENTNSSHTAKEHAVDVRNLAYEMSKDSMIKRTKREVGHKTTNIIAKGLLNLFKGGITRFNQKATYAREQLAPAADENIDMDDE
jgi:hypothetical protein